MTKFKENQTKIRTYAVLLQSLQCLFRDRGITIEIINAPSTDHCYSPKVFLRQPLKRSVSLNHMTIKLPIN